ncbi:MAG: ABC transporter substrate-binding protein, partial [Halococcoides sp.]
VHAIGTGTLAGVAGCAGGLGAPGDDQETATREITDGYGRTVAVPETVERVVGIGSGALRQLAYLGVTDRVVGVEDEDESILSAPYNLANADLRELPVVGSAGPDAGGNPEALLSVDPDVICYYGDPSRADALESQTGTPVVGLEIVDIVDEAARETMSETWRLLGDVLGTGDRAAALIDFLEETIADLRSRTADLADDERERAYVGAISYKGSHGIETTRKRFPPFRFAGVENVAGEIDTDAPSVQISSEQLLEWDPTTMFVAADNLGLAREDVESTAAYQDLAAVERGEVHTILPHASYHHNYGSILSNAYFVGHRLYPDRFDDVDLQSRIDEIFETMLGSPLYAELLEAYPAYEAVM